MDKLDQTIIESILRKFNLSLLGEPQRYTSGIIHRVYDLGKYVLKIEGDYGKTLQHQGKILNKLKSLGARVPQAVDYGEVDGKAYLLMEKIEGTNIVYDWMKMTMAKREKIIAQLAEQLQIYHSVRFDKYSISITSGKDFTNLQPAMERVANFHRIDKDALETNYREDIDFLETYYQKYCHLLDEKDSAVLVHNDIHLENIFHVGDQISGIIDFDWACQAPKDYELWKIIEVVREPKYTVEQKLEPLYENYQMTTEFDFLKKYYPTLFNVQNLAERIRLYYLSNKIIGRVEDWQKGKATVAMNIVQQEIKDLFKSNWLDNLLA